LGGSLEELLRKRVLKAEIDGLEPWAALLEIESAPGDEHETRKTSY
jgi:hypothetical protein